MGLYYGDYLKLDKILSSQIRESELKGKPAHDEMLFIVIHQTYELWFKQILFEIDSIIELMTSAPLPAENLSIIRRRLNRVNEILKILVNQLTVMETMTSLDFMDFRDYLTPASGFQSIQFRILEQRLGLKFNDRLDAEKIVFSVRLSLEDQKKLQEEEKKPSLFEVTDQWLARMPFSENDSWNFWQEYKAAVKLMLEEDKNTINQNSTLNDHSKKLELKNLDATEESFKALFEQETYEILYQKKQIKFSYQAWRNALFINLYRDWPMMNEPFHLLTLLTDLDEHLTTWRNRHAMMAHRLLGTKIGTGGSSGHDYLKKTADKHRCFQDLFNLATFLIPRSKLPKLPLHVKKELTFGIEHEQL
jgi:tryptophan 2,3-dioxygenase